METLQFLRCGQRSRSNHFDRDDASETHLPCLINHSHATAADFLQQFEVINCLSGNPSATGARFPHGVHFVHQLKLGCKTRIPPEVFGEFRFGSRSTGQNKLLVDEIDSVGMVGQFWKTVEIVLCGGSFSGLPTSTLVFQEVFKWAGRTPPIDQR